MKSEWHINHQGNTEMCQEEQKAKLKLYQMNLAHDSVLSSNNLPFLKEKYSVGGIMMKVQKGIKADTSSKDIIKVIDPIV